MLLKISEDYDINEVIKVLQENGFSDVKKTCWQTELIDCEVEYRKENDSKEYSDEAIKKTEEAFREILDEDLDSTAIDNEYLSRKWMELLEEFSK